MKLRDGIPRHTQISNWLREQIESNRFKPEEKLPSENDLAKKFQVSRVTVRRALQSLENESFIFRHQGLGSFVSENRTPHYLVKLTDFDEDMASAGLAASSAVQKFEVTDAPGPVCENLELEPGAKVLQIDRVRLGNQQAVAFDTTWLPLFYGQLLTQEKLEQQTIYNILENEYEIPITKGTYRFSAESADETLSRELNVEPGTPLFLIERTTYTIKEKPLYYQKRYYRNDRVAYEMTLERKGNEPVSEMPIKEFVPVFREQEVE